MNQREKMLLAIIGSVLGVFVLYKGVDFLFVSPAKEASAKIVNLEAEQNRLEGVLRSRRALARRWVDCSQRTLARDLGAAGNVFAHDIKEIARRHGFGSGAYSSPSAGTKIGSRTNINCLSLRVVEEGKFANMLAFLSDLYRTPYLTDISRLSIAPISERGRGRDEVKFDVVIETPILPVVDAKKIPEARSATTMPAEDLARLPPAREDARFAESFPLLADRNIFRRYIPPPTNIVMVDNKDWKPVFLKLRFLWEGKPRGSEIVDSVPERSNKTFTREGDAVEISGTYADASPIGPNTLNFSPGQNQIYGIPVHSPAPPPKVVDLTVENQDKNPVEVQIAQVRKDSTSKVWPIMKIPPGASQEIDKFEAVTVQIYATYASGKKTQARTLTPTTEPQRYVVPPEPLSPAPTVTQDPAADATLVVSGLLTYPGAQELVASGPAPNQRKVFRAGEEPKLDGGTLLAVHPHGGVVKMPTGNYYFYPLGKKFTDRVKLEAKEDSDLAQAIDACLEH